MNHELTLSDEKIDTILNSFNAQRIRIKDNVTDAKKRKAFKEAESWGPIQALSDAAAKDVRDQTGREEICVRGEG